jgi:hypothetical protein
VVAEARTMYRKTTHSDDANLQKCSRPVRKYAIVLAIILFAAFCLQAYAHLYVQITDLPVVNSQNALRIPYGPINGTCIFSYGGAKWLLIMQLPTSCNFSNPGFVTFYIVKTQESNWFLVQRVDIVAEQIMIESTFAGLETDGSLSVYSLENYSVAKTEYIATWPGTCNVDFALNFKVYETTLIGIFQVQESTIHFNQTLFVPV